MPLGNVTGIGWRADAARRDGVVHARVLATLSASLYVDGAGDGGGGEGAAAGGRASRRPRGDAGTTAWLRRLARRGATRLPAADRRRARRDARARVRRRRPAPRGRGRDGAARPRP